MGAWAALPEPSSRSIITYGRAVAEAKRVLAVLHRGSGKRTRRWNVGCPWVSQRSPDKAIVYPDPFDCARFGMNFAQSAVEIIDGVEAVK